MSELTITIGLVVGVVGFGWLIWRVLGTLAAGGENSSRADTRAVGDLPGSEHIDDLTVESRRGRVRE